MRKILTAVVALAFLSCSGEKEKQGNLDFSGKVEGLKQGKLYIQQIKDTAFVAIDSVIFNGNENFQTKFQIDEPQMLYLFLDRGETNSIDNNLMFFAEPGKMTLNTKLASFFASAKFTGSENQKLYEDYQKMMSRFSNSQLELTEKKLRAFQFNRQAPSDLEQKNNDLIKRRYLFAINFAINNKQHEIAPYVALSEIYDANLKYLETIQSSLTPKVAKSKYGKMLTEFISERKELEQ